MLVEEGQAVPDLRIVTVTNHNSVSGTRPNYSVTVCLMHRQRSCETVHPVKSL